MRETLEAIKDVSSKIIIIQDIATRTDILSINASIEAARAGEAGKGFSVVAQEVKKLAEKSNLGAAEIISLIDRTKNISTIAGENYLNISNDIKEIEKAVSEITHSTMEQKISVDQINNAVAQVNESSHNNANYAVELFESVKEIQTYIEKLDSTLTENKTIK